MNNTTYSTGAVSVGAASTTVTGVGTAWLTAGIRAGDVVNLAGLMVVIASVTSNTSLTLRRGWPGAAQTGANYDILMLDDQVRALAATSALLGSLGAGTLSSLAGLAGAANKLPYFTGSGVMGLTDLTADARTLLGSTTLSRAAITTYASYPEFFGAIGNDTANDTAAIVAWAASGANLALTPGKTYRCSTLVSSGAQINFGAALVNGNGATIKFTETDTSNNIRIRATGAQLNRVNFLWADNAGVGHYFERAMTVGDFTTLLGCTFKATTPQPDTTDESGYDTCLRIDGNGARLFNTVFENIFDCCRAWAGGAVSNFRAFNTSISGYSTGFSLGDFASDVVIAGLVVGAMSPHAGPNPGENAITGGCNNLVIDDVTIDASGEHAIYLATAGTLDLPIRNLTLRNIRVRSSGQCGVKIRGWAEVMIQNVGTANAYAGSVAGTNEDGIRLESCQNVMIFGSGSSNENGSGGGGYDLIHMNSCREIDIFGYVATSASRAVIRIEDDRQPGSVRDIRIHGLSSPKSAVPLLDILTTGALGDISITGLHARGCTSHIVQINATGSVGRIFVQGDFTTSAALVNNIAGGAGVMVQTLEVTQSATDATAGRLIKVGDFGLGGYAPSIPGDDLNISLGSGTYAFTSAALNAPGTAAAGVMQVFTRSTTISAVPSQFHVVMKNRSSGGVSMWVRNVTGSVYGAWSEILNGGNLTTSNVDATAGRVTKVGDFGLGGTAVNYGSGTAWADVAGVSQMIGAPAISGQPTDKPISGSPFVGWHLATGATRWAEIVQETSGSGAGRLWTRTHNAGVTQDWEVIFSRRSILGNVSQVAGVPTGALIERGSNANGEYARFADGTQICRVRMAGLPTDTAIGAVFRSGDINWTYPAAFGAEPALAASVAGASNLWANARASTTGNTTTAIARMFNFQTDANAWDISIMATGRWF